MEHDPFLAQRNQWAGFLQQQIDQDGRECLQAPYMEILMIHVSNYKREMYPSSKFSQMLACDSMYVELFLTTQI